MNLRHLAKWLWEMEKLAGSCVLEMRPTESGGLVLDMCWRHTGRVHGYTHKLSRLDVSRLGIEGQRALLVAIGNRVAESLRQPPGAP